MKFLKNIQQNNKYVEHNAVLYRNYEQVQVLSEDPFVGIIDNVFDDEHVDHIKNKYEHLYETTNHSFTIDEQKVDDGMDTVYKNVNRTSRDNYSIIDFDPIDQHMRQTVSKICKLPVENCEKTLLGKYQQGQELESHCDAVSFTPHDNLFSFMLTGGQRILTAILYLNDVEKGGETFFDALGFSVKPRKGRLLIFHNVLENANTADLRTSHGSNELQSEIKYIATYWFRINAIDWQLYKQVSEESLDQRQLRFTSMLKNIDYYKQTVTFQPPTKLPKSNSSITSL
jgi:prolyl 4-hydroxylase